MQHIYRELNRNAALPHRIATKTKAAPTAPDVKKHPRPTGLTRAEVREAVREMIG